MKKIFILCLLLPVLCRAQSLDSAAAHFVDGRIAKAMVGLVTDTLVTTFRADATIINADTLLIPPNSTVTYEIFLLNENTTNKDVGRATKSVTITNKAGVYFITAGSDYPAYSGQATISTAKWSINLVGGLPVVQLTGVKAINIFWQLYRRQTAFLYL